jgi:hypothetical protein
MSAELKIYNNTVESEKILDPINSEYDPINSACDPIDSKYDTVNGLDEDDRVITLVTNDNYKVKIPSKYLMVSDLWKIALTEDKSINEIEVNVSEKVMKYIIQYVNIRGGQEIRIGYSHMATMNKTEKMQEEKRLRDAGISYKCRSSRMDENLLPCDGYDYKKEIEFIDQFNHDNGDDLLLLAESANYVAIHSLLALCMLKIKSFTIGIKMKDLALHVSKIFKRT